MQDFEAKAIASRIDRAIAQLCAVLLKANQEELDKLREELTKEIRDHKNSGILTIAFVGQYNAGKSTTISALTGRRDIRIDSDVATDKTSEYDWEGIKLIDTPGLYAGRDDHDDITYRAIARADLLVFCLTYMLFDSITLSNFKKLAYDWGYHAKMMLLVNKMSDEAGEFQQKIESYQASLTEAIRPHALSEFLPSYVDAKDYCEGCDSDDSTLKEISYFPDFIKNLNQFIRVKGVLGQLDTPIRIALVYLDQAKDIVRRDSVKDDTFFELMNRLKRRLDKSRDHLDQEANSILIRMYQEIVSEGDRMAFLINGLTDGTDGKESFEKEVEQCKKNIQQIIQRVQHSIQTKLEEEVQTLRRDVEELNRNELFCALQAKLDAAEHGDLLTDLDLSALRDQINGFQGVGSFILTTGFAVETVESLFGLGELLGGIEPLMGGFIDLLGPGIAVYGAWKIFEEWHKQQEADKKLADAQIAVQREFAGIARKVEQNFKEGLKKFKESFYGNFEERISEVKGREEEKIAVSNEILGELLVVQKQLEGVRRELGHI